MAALPTLASRAEAQNYPWCSNFADGAGTNCGWSTQEQCMTTLAGSGGYCSQNNLYKPPGATVPTRRKTAQKHTRNSS